MRYDIIPLLKCPICNTPEFEHLSFTDYSPQEIDDGVLWCRECRNWFPIQDGLLDLLTGSLIYTDDRKKFWDTHSVQLEKIGLPPEPASVKSKKDLQAIQQTHFDWYASNEIQTYDEYEKQPFWLAADKQAFEPWRKEITPGSLLLDVGCAEGRGSFKLMDLDIDIIGFDISKALVKQAIHRYRAGGYKARASFCVADASSFPFKSSTFNLVLIYGVLHHLPDPIYTCKEIARVLKLNGKYIGSENNKSVFRLFFDLLQKLNPLWHEEAGPEALISKEMIGEAFGGTGVRVETITSVFLPPHIVNLFSQEMAYQLLSKTDRFFRALPIIRDNGGLIIIHGIKFKDE